MKSKWSLKEEEKNLFPLKFSNGKTQEDIVNEVLKEIKNHKIIFIRGKCGTGKSAIALNIAKELGKTSIVVPIKTLQKQYEHDYSNKKQIIKDGKKLKIDVIRGRANFKCPFVCNQEKQIKLGEKKQVKNSCDHYLLPCKIEIKKKNKKKIKEYLRENEDVSSNLPMSRVRRLSIAPICPYWSPIVPSEIDLSILKADKKRYKALNNKEYVIYKRKEGCGYYDQYKAYLDSDVIIFNSQKYKLETIMDRKPETELEIIDECDEFLDSLSNQKKINLNRLNLSLSFLLAYDQDTRKSVDKLIKISSEILTENKNPDSEKIIPLKNTKMHNLLNLFLDSKIMDNVDCDEENYSYNVEEAALTFQDFFQETYVSFSKENNDLIARLVTTSIEKRFKKILDKNKSFVLMSGTIHSEKVLKEIFGLEDFKIIDAETKTPGTITPIKTGYEIDCSYRTFVSGRHTREEYLQSLQSSIEKAPKPLLVHITSFFDLPSEKEKKDLNLDIISREKLKKLQKDSGKLVKRFKEGKIKTLYTTKCNRGVDFPGDICRSIVLTKFPFPNVKSLFWRILKRTHPKYYNDFYLDKARRELFQKIYRGLRYEKDHIFLLSPDSRVFNRFRLDL
jgi:Rad3-related DNA helicase